MRDRVEAFLNEKPAANLSQGVTLWATSSERFRHSGWRRERDRVFASLRRTSQNPSRIISFAACGAGSWVQRRELKFGGFEYRIRCNCCHDRLCTPCASVRAWRLQLAIKHLMQGKRLSFITLTLCGKGQGLGDMLDRLYKHFRALRLHPTWADAVRGGVAFLEIKWNDRAQRWHPHLHIIADAGYIDQGELSTVWRTITKDSYIVDIRRVKEEKQAAAYVTKYASKPLNTSFSNTPALLDEAVIALKGRRLAFAFGEWYGEGLDIESESLLDEGEEGEPKWDNYTSLEECLSGANSGDPYWKNIIAKCGAETAWRLSLESGP